jgi:Pyridoxamine 5'-phosphate oxidase
VTATLPEQARECFARFVTTEYTTVDSRQQPITWPVTPSYTDGAPTIDARTEPGCPVKADDARRHPQVALLFSDPTGSGVERPGQVLVQGTAAVEEAAHATRIDVRVRPERVFVWPDGDPQAPPEIHDSHMEEVRSGHSEEPAEPHVPAAGGGIAWDARIGELGDRHSLAVLSWVGPDGFPISIRLPIAVDRGARRIRIETLPAGLPLAEGRACLTAHAHGEDATWQEASGRWSRTK